MSSTPKGSPFPSAYLTSCHITLQILLWPGTQTLAHSNKTGHNYCNHASNFITLFISMMQMFADNGLKGVYVEILKTLDF